MKKFSMEDDENMNLRVENQDSILNNTAKFSLRGNRMNQHDNEVEAVNILRKLRDLSKEHRDIFENKTRNIQNETFIVDYNKTSDEYLEIEIKDKNTIF